MPATSTAELTEAVYDAAVDVEGWPRVMTLLGRRYHTRVEAFYYLDLQDRGLRSISIRGVSPAFYRDFAACYYTPDNPCLRSPSLHRQGAVRTDQHLLAYFADVEVLRRSTYYNEWMRPQQLLHTLGTTPLADDGLVLNLSLLRGADRGAFQEREVREFARWTRHLQRALRMALRIDSLRQMQAFTEQMLEHLPHGVLVVDGQCRLLHANAQAHAWLQQRHGLMVRAGRIAAATPADAEAVQALVMACTRLRDAICDGAPDVLALQTARPPLLSLQAMPLRCAATPWSLPRSAVLLCLSTPAAPQTAFEALARRHGLTAAEQRLARELADGSGLRQAAERAGMRYQTARWYLKILFHKCGVRRQAELVRLLQTGC